MESFLAHPWAVWLTIAIVAGILEMTLPSFTCIFAAFAGAIAAVVALKAGWPLQICTFALVLITSVAFLRPFLIRKFPPSANMPSRSEALVGLKGKVTTAINPATGEGRVLVEGADWAAKSERPIAENVLIVVVGHDGIVLNVKES